MKSSRTKGRAAAGLTASQIVILRHAAKGPIRMARGDRLGTRCAYYEDDHAVIVAYQTPEIFLHRRGLIQTRNFPHTFDITAAGRSALAKAEATLGYNDARPDGESA